MPVYLLDKDYLLFPSATLAEKDGLLAVGGMLREDWLLKAYAEGIFPWFNTGQQILWWSPNPRFVIYPAQINVQKSMRPYLNNPKYEFKLDTAFEEVIQNCAYMYRKDQQGTWISKEMQEAYTKLHKIGVAHSAEIWHNDVLVGGLYGVSLGKVFFGESMFYKEKNMSKLALIRLAQWLEKRGFTMIDCQVFSKHIVRMGAIPLARIDFLKKLEEGLKEESIRGKWQAEEQKNRDKPELYF